MKINSFGKVRNNEIESCDKFNGISGKFRNSLVVCFLSIFSLFLYVNCAADSASSSQCNDDQEGGIVESSDFKIRKNIRFVSASEEEKEKVRTVPEDETQLLRNIIDEAKTSKKYELAVIAQEKIASFQPSFENYYDLASYQGSIGDFNNATISCTRALDEGSGEEMLYMYCHVLKAIYLGASDLYKEAADELMIVLKSEDMESKPFVFQDLVAPPVYPILKTKIEDEINNDPENYRWLLYLGRLYQTTGDYKNAIATYKECYNKSNDFSFLKLIADCYEKSGNEKMSKYFYDKYESVLHDILFK